MIDLAKMVEAVATAGQAKVPAIAWTNGDSPESVRLVCIGYVNPDTLADYLAHSPDDPDLYPPLPFRKLCRHATTPVYIAEPACMEEDV